MMKLRYLFYVILGCCSLVACNDEDGIIPREPSVTVRYEFPQGTNEWDRIAEEIHESHGVYLIYKGYSQIDFSRAWTSAGSGREYCGDSLTGEQVRFYMKFMKEHVFQYIPSELSPTVFPPYYLLVYNYRTESISILDGTVSKSPITNFLQGLDFWVSSIISETNSQFPSTKEKLKEHRVRILKPFFETAFNRGRIKQPVDFHTGFDYKTALVTYPSTELLKRGFLGPVTGDGYSFGTWWGISYVTPEANLISYLFACLRYTEAEFLALYPEATYPLISKKRKLLINHMKEKYNIDLEAIAKGPEL